MSHRSTYTSHFKIYGFPLKLRRLLRAITQRVFDAADGDAYRYGWQVTATHSGFGRTYRDPRFDQLVPCTSCNGRGRNHDDTACSACHGTGRIILNPAALSRQVRGQP